MKLILLLSAFVFISACSHKHGDHNHGDHHHGDKAEKCGCGHEEEKADTCKACTSACGDKCEHHKDGHNCADCAAHGGKKKWELADNTQLNASISEEDFQKAYLANSAKLGMSCTSAAQEYCGKTTKDMMVTEQEVGCLWAKAHRVTREKLPKLDKTACEKLLKGMAPKKKK